MERRRAALTLTRVGVIGHLRELGETLRQLLILIVGAHRLARVPEHVVIIEHAEILWDVEHLGVVVTHEVTAGGDGDFAESEHVHVGEFDVFVAPET